LRETPGIFFRIFRPHSSRNEAGNEKNKVSTSKNVPRSDLVSPKKQIPPIDDSNDKSHSLRETPVMFFKIFHSHYSPETRLEVKQKSDLSIQK